MQQSATAVAAAAPVTQEHQAAEELTDVPAALAPAKDRRSDSPDECRPSATGAQEHGEAPEMGSSSRPSPSTAPHRSPRRRAACGVALPKGAFSLRSSTAVLSGLSPLDSSKREVEAAGWEAAAYPFDAPEAAGSGDAELDSVIASFMHDMGANGATSAVHAAATRLPPPPYPREEDTRDRHHHHRQQQLSGDPSTADPAPDKAKPNDDDGGDGDDSSSSSGSGTSSSSPSEDAILVYCKADLPASNHWNEQRPSDEHPADDSAEGLLEEGAALRVAAEPEHRDPADVAASAVEVAEAVPDVTVHHKSSDATGRRVKGARRRERELIKGYRKGSYANPTASWAKYLSASVEEEEAKAESGGDAANRVSKAAEGATAVSGGFRLATAERVAETEAKRTARQERRSELARMKEEEEEQRKRGRQGDAREMLSTTDALAKPKGFDTFAEEGRRKRQLREEEEQRKRLELEQNLTFKPAISDLAMQRKKASASASDGVKGDAKGYTPQQVEAFVAASMEWMERRERRIALLQRRLQAEEEEERRRRFVNAETERIVGRKKGEAVDGDRFTTVFERLAAMPAKPREQRPTSPPKPTRTPLSPALETTEAVASAAAEAGEQKPPASFFEELYQRRTRQKAEAEKRLERAREEAAASHTAPSAGGKRRTPEEIRAFVEQMAAREAERRERLEQQLQRRKEAEEAALAQGRSATAVVDRHSAKLARRGRQRAEWREQQKRRARELEEQQKRKSEEAAAAAKSARHAVSGLPASFEAHEMRSEERRARNLGRLRQQLLEQEMAECTFKPKVCRASEELASRVRWSLLEEEEEGGGGGANFALFRRTPSDGPIAAASHSLDRAGRPVVRAPAAASFVSPVHDGQPPSRHSPSLAPDIDASPAPRCPPPPAPREQRPDESAEPMRSAGSSGEELPRSTISLEEEIADLEEVLRQWKELENTVDV